MDLSKIEERLLEIEIDIGQLEAERAELTKTYLKESNDFWAKFRVWYNNSKEKANYHWIPSRDKFPIFRKQYIDQNKDWLNKGATYTLENFFEDQIYIIFNYDECVEDSGKEFIDKELEDHRALFEELMNGDLYSFVFDW